MKMMHKPNPNTIYPITGYKEEIYIKPTVKKPNIIVNIIKIRH